MNLLAPWVLAFGVLAGSAPLAVQSKVVWVDCGATEAGDGSVRAPFTRITDAVSARRTLASAHGQGTIVGVRPGVCLHETFPIVLDYRVWVRGSRVGWFDSDGLPTGDQTDDTIVVGGVSVPFFRVAADDVRITAVSLDGQRTTPQGTDALVGAILVAGARNFEVSGVRVVNASIGVAASASSGRVHGSFFGVVDGGMQARPGTADSPAKVVFDGNRVSEYPTGAITLIGADPGGDHLEVVLAGNEFVTTFQDTGPSNPFGLRVAAVAGGPPNIHGTVVATVSDNVFRGSHRYPLIVSGGNVLRTSGGVADPRPYAGTFDLAFHDNTVDLGEVTGNGALITYTNSRATELPCELDPANAPPACPTVMGGRYWKYLRDSVFNLVHTGELDGVWIDHPAADPVGGAVLNNVLIINGDEIAHQTFVVVPAS